MAFIKKMFLVLMLSLMSLVLSSPTVVLAQDGNAQFAFTTVYSIYDEDFNLLFQKDIVSVGDGYLSEDYKYYEVVYVDDTNHTGIAKFISYKKLPDVDVSFSGNQISITQRTICMYMTHNDESYVPSDGVDSVYGNGGVKDVALALKSELEKHFVDVYFDDTLHIPHDTNAYTRSQKTASKLLKTYSPDAIFDIHRDATSRKFYVSNVNGKERGRVRMVIGKANPNMKVNEEFALYIMAVAKKMYPWLMTDIFYATGHYNQSLCSKAILFECGCHLIEKELEIESMRELADVITTALYGTTVNKQSGDLTIGGSENEQNTTINDYFEEKQNKSNNVSVLAICLLIAIMSSVSLYAIVYFFKTTKKVKGKNTENKR